MELHMHCRCLVAVGVFALGLALPSAASSLANPASMMPAGRIAIGASYHLGGYSITDSSIGSVMNRFHARITYSPLQYVNFGIDIGTTQMDVDSTTIYSSATDSVGTHYSTFQGGYGFSFGAHLKAGTPRFFNDMVGIVGIGAVTMFSSTNEKSAKYSGWDGSGALGLQFRIPKFGYVTAGTKLYMIKGDNESYNGQKGYFWNTDNVQGWLAIDFVPTFKGQMKGNPYFSVEMTMVPGVEFGGSVPIRGFSLSIAVGWISPRLYGEEFEDVE
jgi:hypothetical protein